MTVAFVRNVGLILLFAGTIGACDDMSTVKKSQQTITDSATDPAAVDAVSAVEKALSASSAVPQAPTQKNPGDERLANANCRFIVDGKPFIDGPCRVDDDEYSSGPDFKFDDLKMKLECPNGEDNCFGNEWVTVETGTFGGLGTSEDSITSGYIFWNGGGAQAAHEQISPVILRDGCWIAANAELCVQMNPSIAADNRQPQPTPAPAVGIDEVLPPQTALEEQPSEDDKPQNTVDDTSRATAAIQEEYYADPMSCGIVNGFFVCDVKLDSVFIDNIVVNRGNCSSLHKSFESELDIIAKVYSENSNKLSDTEKQLALDDLYSDLHVLLMRSQNDIEENYRNATNVQDDHGELRQSFKNRIAELMPEITGMLVFRYLKLYKFGERLVYSNVYCNVLEVKIDYYDAKNGNSRWVTFTFPPR